MEIIGSFPMISSSLTQDPETLVVRIDVNAVDGKIPEDDDYVRIPRMNGFWSFTPLADGKVNVVYQGQISNLQNSL